MSCCGDGHAQFLIRAHRYSISCTDARAHRTTVRDAPGVGLEVAAR